MIVMPTIVTYFSTSQGALVSGDVSPLLFLEKLVEGSRGLFDGGGTPLALFLGKATEGCHSFGVGAVECGQGVADIDFSVLVDQEAASLTRCWGNKQTKQDYSDSRT